MSKPKILSTLFLCLIPLLMFGCNGSSGVTVSYDGKSDSIEPNSTAVLASTVSDSVMHTFVIANYDLGKEVTRRSLQGSAKKEGNMRVQFKIIGEKGTDESTPIKVGKYISRVGNSGSSVNSTNGGRIALALNGKEDTKSLISSETKEGSVNITSVSGDTVSGEVDLTDGKTSIKGKFSAKMLS